MFYINESSKLACLLNFAYFLFKWSLKFCLYWFFLLSKMHQTDVTFSPCKKIFYSWFIWKINLQKVLELMGIHNLTSVFLRIINSAEEHWGPGRQDFSSPSLSVIIVKNKASMDLHLTVVPLFSRFKKKKKVEGLINAWAIHQWYKGYSCIW